MAVTDKAHPRNTIDDFFLCYMLFPVKDKDELNKKAAIRGLFFSE